MKKYIIIGGSILTAFGLGYLACHFRFERPRALFVSKQAAVISYVDAPGWRGYPMLEASINGVNGLCLVDTGSNTPILSAQGVRACGIDLSQAKGKTQATWESAKTPMKEITNVTLRIMDGNGVEIASVRWPHVLANHNEHPWMAIIDLPTLERLNAIINTKERTITISQ